MIRSVRYAERSRLALVPRIAMAVAVLALVALLGGAVGTWVVANNAMDARLVVGLARAEHDVTNVLVATAADDAAPVDGVAIVQVAPTRERPAVLVLPAALELDVADVGRVPLGRVPGAGGMALLVEEVTRYTGVDLHHYVRVDRSALADVVDANGGVDDCPTPDADPCPRLIGAQVAQRLAAPQGAVSGASRVVAHLDVAGAVASEVGRTRTALDPRRALRWARGWDAVLTTDVDLGVQEARALAASVAQVDAGALDVRILPGLVDDGRVTAEPEQATILLTAFARAAALPEGIGLDAPRAAGPQDVTVRVLNGLGRAGVAGDMAAFLEGEGFEVDGVDNAPVFDPDAATRIDHVAGARRMAQMVRRALGRGRIEAVDALPKGVDVVVTVGRGGAP